MKECVNLILEWYLDNKRFLPWRMDLDPYHVWISEIMLQQTRIEAVIPYYQRFMERIPTIQALSEIDEDQLLKLWEGLGYYTRARNLKKAAITIMEKYGGVFPREYQEILSLPGIGEYTAGAISSICFQAKEVCVDGNVMRVYCRIQNLDLDVSNIKVKKEISLQLKKILPEDSGSFNQGIMELGEVICIPNGQAKCEICPLQRKCKAHLLGKENSIPRKIQKKEKKEEIYTIIILQYQDKFAIRKREEGLLNNMWEFPTEKGKFTLSQVKKKFPQNLCIKKAVTYQHIFTHKKWILYSYYIEVSTMIEHYSWVSLEKIEKDYALPGAFQPIYTFLQKK